MNKNLFLSLEVALKKDPRFISNDENQILLKNVIRQAAIELDESLISLLLDDTKLREVFFKPIRDAIVFDSKKFINFLNNKEFLPDSYTAFKNKVGLSNIAGDYLSDSDEVVLSFPYKDCVLAGGQDKEDTKRQEVFYNEILGRDEIDRLLDPKTFTHFKKYSSKGEEKVSGFTRGEDGVIQDNLIIKGNNLLALHSLKKEFAGKVKLIYIDPPYNTGNDGFKYNDRFNHSTWLTFMKNRLEVAGELLRDDGVIFVQCDDNEQAYLKVLMDDILGKNNFVDSFIWKNTDNAPTLSNKVRGGWEFIHCYEKNLDRTRGYIGKLSDNGDAPLLNTGNSIGTLLFMEGIIDFKIADGVYKAGNIDRIELLDELVVENGKNKNKIRVKGPFKWSQKYFDDEVQNGTTFLIKSNKFSIRYQREEATNVPPEKYFEDNYLSKSLGVETNEDSKKHINILGLDFPSFPKPESLIAFIIKAVSEEGDIVLDYHLGSGTTAAVAHKMGRQYIGVEQMDYIETISVERMKKVIEGEQGGVSKSVEWKGGGEFVYMELMEANQKYLDMISGAKDTKALLSIYEEMQKSGFINYYVDIQSIDENISEFEMLSLENQKKFLADLLDKNLLYVNHSEIDDVTYGVSDEEKKLNREFYK